MRLLELFSGTGSVRKAVGNRFEEIISIDILQKFNPTECCDILDWNYKKYPIGYFEVVWASPPCTEYSKVLNSRPDRIRDLNGANRIVEKTIEIIEYFNPDKWFIENPQTGLLKDQDFMMALPFVDVDYCRYGFPYRKRTRIWTNVEYEGKLCEKLCGNIIGNRHKNSIGNSSYEEFWNRGIDARLHQRYAIPPALIQDLFNA